MRIIILFILTISLLSCSFLINNYDPLNEQIINNNLYYYISTNGNDNNPGTKNKPLLTIQEAINRARNKPSNVKNIIINIATGIYTPDKGLNNEGSGVYVPYFLSNVQLIGGWDLNFTTNTNYSILDGEYKLFHILHIEGYNFWGEKLHLKCGLAKGSSKYNPILSYPTSVFYKPNEPYYDKDGKNYKFVFPHTYYGGGIFAVTKNLRMIDIIIESNYAWLGGGAYIFGDQNYCKISNLSYQFYEYIDNSDFLAIDIINTNSEFSRYIYPKSVADHNLITSQKLTYLSTFDIITNFYDFKSESFLYSFGDNFNNIKKIFSINPYLSSTIYISYNGNDNNNGLTPKTPIRTLSEALQKIKIYNSIGSYIDKIYITKGNIDFYGGSYRFHDYNITNLIIIGGWDDYFSNIIDNSRVISYNIFFDTVKNNLELYNIIFDSSINSTNRIIIDGNSILSNCIFGNNIDLRIKRISNQFILNNIIFSNFNSQLELELNNCNYNLDFIDCKIKNFVLNGINNNINFNISKSEFVLTNNSKNSSLYLTSDGNCKIIDNYTYNNYIYSKNFLINIENCTSNRYVIDYFNSFIENKYPIYEYFGPNAPVYYPIVYVDNIKDSSITLKITNISNNIYNTNSLFVIKYFTNILITNSILKDINNYPIFFDIQKSYGSLLFISNNIISNNYYNGNIDKTIIFKIANFSNIIFKNNSIETIKNSNLTNIIFFYIPYEIAYNIEYRLFPIDFQFNEIIPNNISITNIISIGWEYYWTNIVSNNWNYPGYYYFYKIGTYNDLNNPDIMNTTPNSTNNILIF